MAFVSSLMREKRAGNVSSILGITTEYCGTFSNVGGSDASTLVNISESAFLHEGRNSVSRPVSRISGAFPCRGMSCD